MFSFLIQRLTGVALVFYLFMHIWSIGHIRSGEKSFNDLMKAYNSPSGHVIEYLLLLCVLFHMVNGIRIVAVDFLSMTRSQKPIFWGSIAVMIVIAVFSIFFFFPEVK